MILSFFYLREQMIIRIIQNLQKDIEHTFITEVFSEKLQKWSPIEKCQYHFKNAKVRIKDDIVFLVGHSVDTEEELSNFTVDFLAKAINWNDDVTTYKYINWVIFFEAYY